MKTYTLLKWLQVSEPELFYFKLILKECNRVTFQTVREQLIVLLRFKRITHQKPGKQM
jgi:hypothetical protein